MDIFQGNKPPLKIINIGSGSIEISHNTAEKMKSIILKSFANPYVRKHAEVIIQNCPGRNDLCEINAIYEWVQQHVRYVHDPRGMEYLQTPPYVLKSIELGQVPGLDCDDYTLLILSLLKSIGYQVAIRVTGYEPIRKDSIPRYGHVYGLVRALIPEQHILTGQSTMMKQWIVVDGIPDGDGQSKPLNWEAPNPTCMFDLEV